MQLLLSDADLAISAITSVACLAKNLASPDMQASATLPGNSEAVGPHVCGRRLNSDNARLVCLRMPAILTLLARLRSLGGVLLLLRQSSKVQLPTLNALSTARANLHLVFRFCIAPWPFLCFFCDKVNGWLMLMLASDEQRIERGVVLH